MKIKVIFATLLLCMLISLTAVSAVDINQAEDFVAQDSDMVTQEILADENTGGGDFKTLQNEINASADNTFDLERNYTYDPLNDSEYTSGILIDKDNFTIDGHGFTIDALNNARIFNITGNGVTLKNINFINAYTDGSGGAIAFKDAGTVINCTFTNNTAKNNGGAVYFSGNGDVLNCNFNNNNASSSRGGALYLSGNGDVLNCNFNNNSGGNGGAVYIENAFSNSKINSTFINNSAFRGGAIFFNNETYDNIIDGYFEGNTAQRIGGAIVFLDAAEGNQFGGSFTHNHAGHGGAIYFDKKANNNTFDCDFNFNIVDSIGGAIVFATTAYNNNFTGCFVNNTASNMGGAITFTEVSSNCLFTGDFINNTAKNGGALYFYGDVNNATIAGCFKGNDAERAGGAIFVRGQSEDNDFVAEFSENKARQASGGAIFFNSLAERNTFEGIFARNYALYGGAVFFYKKANFNKFNSNFTSNVAKSCGGAMFFYNTTDGNNFTGCFINNSALGQVDDSVGNGGAMTFKNTSANSIFTCDFINNTAKLNGGAVNYRQTPYNITFNCNFVDNGAKYGGGVNFMESFENVIFNGEFIGNTANQGGAIYINASVSNFNINSTFINNTAKNGGALYFYGKVNNAVIAGCFKGNDAERAGGAIFVRGQSEDNDFVAEFSENKARQASGGAIFFNALAERNTFESIFTSNYALYGGAVFFYKKANFNKFNSNFTSNVAKSCGGAMFFYNTTDGNNFTGCFINNSALGQVDDSVGNGGAITFKNTSANSIFTCDFINNTAKLNGGGLNYRQTPYNITLNCNFINNTSPRGGGLNFFESFENVIFNSEFIGNSAVNGGAIAAVSGIIKNVSFKDNHAEYGGAVYFAESGEVMNCNFTNNTAENHGGAVYFNQTGNVTNSYFTNNRANNGDGGAIRLYEGNVTDCNFAGNSADEWGGAICMYNGGNVSNCNFEANSAYRGGAIWADCDSVSGCNFAGNSAYKGGAIGLFNGSVTDCSFTDNNATSGSAIYFEDTSSAKNVSNSLFLNNMANAEDLQITKNENNITIVFTGKDNLLNAIYCDSEVNFSNVTYWGANGEENTGIDAKLSGSKNEAGQNITVGVIVDGAIVLNEVRLTDENGTIVLDITAGDNYYITARHSTDSYYTEAETAVSNMTFNVNVTSQTTYNKTVNITAESNIPNEVIKGNLMFIVPDTEPIAAVYAGNGTWWAEHAFEDYGVYQITATFTGSDNVTVNNGTIAIIKANSSITQDDIVLDYGDSVNVTVTATGATGITAKIDGKDVEVIDNYTIPVSGLDAGNYTLVITTVPDDDHVSVNKTVNITVNKLETELSGDEVNTTYDVLKNLVITLKDVNGNPLGGKNITVDLNGVNTYVSDKNGQVNVSTEGLTPDNYTAKVTFDGDTNYEMSAVEINVTITEGRLVVSAPDLVKYYSGPERFVVNVTYADGRAVGGKQAYITINGVTYRRVTDENGSARLNINLHAGTYDVTVAVDNVSVNSTVTVKTTVKGDDIISDVKTVRYFVWLVDGEGNFLENGTAVEFNINGQIYIGYVCEDEGMAYVDLILDGGSYVITATNPVTGEKHSNEISINTIDPDINVTAPAITVGQNATVTVSLPDDATGNVTIGNESVPVKDGTAIAVIPDLPVGINTISVVYSGDYRYNSAVTSVDVIVNEKPAPPKENLTIAASADEITEGENATVLVYGLENATGNVSLVVSGRTFTAPIDNGEAVFIVPDLVENATALISYPGDYRYNPANVSVNIVVNRNATLVVSAENLTKYYGSPDRFTVKVTDAKGQAVSNKTVNITVNGVTYRRTTNENGSASLGINFNSGEYPITVGVDDVVVKSMVTVMSTIDAADVVKVFRNATQYYATFADSNGSILPNTSVSFNINGVIYNRTTDGNGTAKLNINLEAGEYILTASNPVTGEMKSNTIKVISLIESDDLVKYYRNASQFVVRIHSADGGYVGAGESVTFNINGVFYTRTTNATGHAKLNINLGAGDYIITSEYNGCRAANNISVLPVLSAEDISMKYRDGTKFVAALVDGQGNAYTGQSVTFNINGVFYNRVTDSNGQARLNINLMAGEYIITSSYGGFNIANTIKITA